MKFRCLKFWLIVFEVTVKLFEKFLYTYISLVEIEIAKILCAKYDAIEIAKERH